MILTVHLEILIYNQGMEGNGKKILIYRKTVLKPLESVMNLSENRHWREKIIDMEGSFM